MKSVFSRMTMYEHDPELTRWGLHHLLGDSTSSSGCQNHSCVYAGEYLGEGNSGADHNNVEDDETIARALQEEFSLLAEGQAQGSEFDQYWESSMKYILEGDEQQGGGDDVASSSCSSPEKQSESKEWLLELAEDFHNVDEVGKRLNQVSPAPHKPRINREIPSPDEAVSDHQRLTERLDLYDLVERKVEGDGNCQFRALSDQFYRTPEHHKFVRQQVINQLKSHPEIYEGYVPMTYAEYLKKMAGNGEWGDHVTLQAAADSYGVKIFVFTSFKDTCCIEILPAVEKSKRVVLVSFWAEVHYNSIYPDGGAEMPELEPKRKKWWPFGHRR